MAVTNTTTGEAETVTLTETGVNTGVFTGQLTSSASATTTDNDGTLRLSVGDALKVEYIDPTSGQNGKDIGFDNPNNPGITGDYKPATTTFANAVGSGVSIDNITVNEGSPYAVFEVKATKPADTLTLQLADVSAVGGTNASDTSGGTDYLNNSLEYFDEVTDWVAYASSAKVPVGSSSLFVRVKIVNDDKLDGGEHFSP